MPAHRKLFVISDLHLGGQSAVPGQRGFRLCTQEAQLAQFIDALTALADPVIELVINGDLVDFLAEETGDPDEKWSPFHYPESKAVDRLAAIVRRSAIVFDALKRFLAAPRHRLVILPGNHDVELNLPAVRRALREAVGANGAADYEFIAHGEAYRAGDVLIEHGNRVDDMNFVDYHSLRHLCGLLSRGMAVMPQFRFNPPAGSKLVAEIMNPIKEHYGFIDLLKPEAEAAFPVLLALEPGRRADLARLAAALAIGKLRRVEQDWSAASNISARPAAAQPAAAAPEISPEDALGDLLERTVGRRDFGRPPRPSEAGSGSAQNISLGSAARSLWALLRAPESQEWPARLPDLLEALRKAQSPSAFDRQHESATEYWDEAKALGRGPVRHVVFGHTHLAKQVNLPGSGRGCYFNSGTWADILELPRSILEENHRQLLPLAELETFVRDLVAQDFSRYTTFRPTFVRVEQDVAGQSVRADLCDYSAGAPVE